MSDAALYEALAKAQRTFPDIAKSKTVDMTLKSGRRLTYQYAPFEGVVNAVRGTLADNGLAFSHLLTHGDNGRPFLQTMLMHKDGGKLEASFPLPVHDNMTAQEIGSAITYMRRYALVSMLGLATEEDDDGGAATDAKPTSSNTAAAPPKQAAAPASPAPAPTSQFKPPEGADTPRIGEAIPVGHEKSLPLYQIVSHISNTFRNTGNTNGRDWTRWDVLVATATGEDLRLSTFSVTLGELAEQLLNTTCVVRFTEQQKGDRLNRNIVALEPSPQATDLVASAAAAAGFPNDDVPFE